MDVDYRKTPQGSFMVLSHPEQKEPDDHSLQMILRNRIPGLLKTGQEILNGQLNLLYDITSMQSFAAFMEKEKIGLEHMQALITDMGNCAERTREYLLDIDQLLFLPEYIFLEQNTGRFLFCLDPCRKGDYQSDIRELFDRILGNIAYEDPDYVKLVYELHTAVQKDNFRFSDLSELMPRIDDSETVSIRGMFEKSTEADRGSSGREQTACSSLSRGQTIPSSSEIREYRPASLLSGKRPETAKRVEGFFEKLKTYLKGKTLREVVSDLDNGVFLQKLNRVKDRKQSEYRNRTEEQEGTGILCLAGFGKHPESLIEIRKFPFSIGKLEGEMDAVIDSPSVSRMHARISENAGDLSSGCLIEDLNSTNGTYVNGIRLEPYRKKQIRAGDVIRFADREYILRNGMVRANNPCNSPENAI